MLLQDLQVSFNGALSIVWANLLSYIPKIVFAIILFAIGWLISSVLGRLVAQIVRALQVDKLFEATGLNDLLKKANFNVTSADIFGGFVKWSAIIVFFTLTMEILQLNQVSSFMWYEVLPFLPKVFVASLIILIGAMIADKVRDLVYGAAKASGSKSAKFVSSLAKGAIWIFAVMTALYQIGVAAAIIQTFITGFVFAVSLAAGLAFGLGGKEEAARYLAKLRKEMSDDNS